MQQYLGGVLPVDKKCSSVPAFCNYFCFFKMLSTLHLELQKNDGINQSLLNEILNTLMNKLNSLENGIQKSNLKESEGLLSSQNNMNHNDHNNNNKEILDIVENKMQFQMNLLNQNIENSITQNQQKVKNFLFFFLILFCPLYE